MFFVQTSLSRGAYDVEKWRETSNVQLRCPGMSTRAPEATKTSSNMKTRTTNRAPTNPNANSKATTQQQQQRRGARLQISPGKPPFSIVI
jgi:hypothetical protein